MNKFDEKYEIRFAVYEEIEEIMSFIDRHWKRGHILGCNRDFFEYEHVINGHVTYLIAKSKETKKIDGIIGYLPASNDTEKLDIWGVVWKTTQNAMPMLGIELIKRLEQYTKARTVLGVGANPKTAVPLLRRLLHYKIGKMKHFYMLSDRDEYKIACIKEQKKGIISHQEVTKAIRLDNFESLEKVFDFDICKNDIPYKNGWYVKRRYFQHPIHKYEIYGLSVKDEVEALLVLRRQEYQGRVAIRIVDYIGRQELFGGLSVWCKELLHETEYIDMYCLGFEEEFILQAGFVERVEDDVNIIPNYFSPYECKNVDIYVDSSSDNCLFFKADGDQDRPN